MATRKGRSGPEPAGPRLRRPGCGAAPGWGEGASGRLPASLPPPPPLARGPAPPPYSVMRLASSVQAAVELAEKTR